MEYGNASNQFRTPECVRGICEYIVTIWTGACKETNLMRYLYLVYSVSILLQVSGLLGAHNQEVKVYICEIGMCCTVRHSQVSAGVVGMTHSRLRRTTRTRCNIYTLLPPDDGLLASLKHVEV
jgi:hypothetical protein